MRKLLVICGPTATGKTALGIKLAKKFKGEIISADSRQVYQSMDVVTGKDKDKFEGIKVWGLDLVKPDEEFSVAHWLVYTQKAIQDIWQRKRLPLVIGGTGFWIKALLQGIASLGIPPDWPLREKLSHCSIASLLHCLEKLDPERLGKMNQSDKNNPRRLIRAIEIAKLKIENSMKIAKLKIENFLIIGLKASNKYLYQRIDKRVNKRIKQGAEKEVKNLVKKGYSWDLPSMTGIGYRDWRAYLEGKKSKAEVIQVWQNSEHAYSRRQMTWFKKNIRQAFGSSSGRRFQGKARWFNIEKASWQNNVVKLVKTWYDERDGQN